ncbi:DNA repair protein RecO [Candidatus Saccharibacteria bacterium]|nr:DNA repair protein RecO [Candidatus Saccharibacteria bacterium]
MPAKTKDYKIEAIVLRRTNYGETDRVLQVITPEGKRPVMAKGVRKEKSKLAGSVEVFCLSELVLHEGKKDGFLVLTGAKLLEFYKGIIADFEKLQIASEILKKISQVAETVDNPEYFELTKQVLKALDKSGETETILAWFYFNLARVEGEQVNLYTDTEGKKLAEGEKYSWDGMEKALRINKSGKISTNEIKMMRLILMAKLELVLKVKEASEMASELLYIAKTLNQI